MGFLTKKTKVKEPAEFAAARQKLLEIGSTTPMFGVQQTAGMTDTELMGQDVLAGYAGGQSAEVQNALNSLKEVGQYTNILDVPEYAALYETGQKDINNQLNRLGRSLQMTGNTSSSSGAGVMMNAVGDLNKELLGSMAPYAAAERERRYNAPLQAADLATKDTENRLAAVKQYGALPRELEQLSLNAEYMANYLNEIAPYQYQVPALSSVGGIGQTTVTGGGLSDAGVGLSILASMFGGGGDKKS